MENAIGKIVSALDGAGTVACWSWGCEAFHGWSRAEAEGKIVLDLLATAFPKPFLAIHSHPNAHDPWPGELTHRHRNGQDAFVTSRGCASAYRGADGP